MKSKIKIEKIFHNKVKTKNGEKDTFTLMYQKIGFKGWGQAENYKEGEVVEIEYDENSKYAGKNTIYYQLIQPKGIAQTEIKIILNTILAKVEKIEQAVCNEKMETPPEIDETPKSVLDGIPVIEEKGIDNANAELQVENESRLG